VLAAASSISAYTLVHGHTPWSLWAQPKQTASFRSFSEHSPRDPRIIPASRSSSCRRPTLRFRMPFAGPQLAVHGHFRLAGREKWDSPPLSLLREPDCHVELHRLGRPQRDMPELDGRRAH
jgi:hypothetical protein